MNIKNMITRPLSMIATTVDYLQPLAALALRLWVGLQFFKSGLTKIASWDTTLYLFREEYHVPLLSPNVAAVAGTFVELVLPVLLWLGLFGRLAALGLSALNVMAVVAYAHVLYATGFEAALGQHYLWGFMLLVLVLYGPGPISLDRMLVGRMPATAHAY